MGFEEKPTDIKRSMRLNNTEHLRAAGRKGGLAAAKNKEIRSIQDALAAEIREAEEWQRQIAANEHIISPDGEDLTDDIEEDTRQ